MPAVSIATDDCHFSCIQGRRKTMCLDCTIANGRSRADIRIMCSPAIRLLEQRAQSLERHKLLLGQAEGIAFMYLCKQALLSMHTWNIKIKCTMLLKILEQRTWKGTGRCLIILRVYLVNMYELIGLDPMLSMQSTCSCQIPERWLDWVRIAGLEDYKRPWIAFRCTFPKGARGAECHSQSLLDC